LGSASLETNETGQVISYEEYHPFGTSAYRVAKSGTDLSLKRYRFTGKERDDETGLYYFGVRYYAAWLGRWTSSDPGDFVDGLNLYVYVRNNPVNGVDALGYETDPPPTEPTNPLGDVADEVVVTAPMSDSEAAQRKMTRAGLTIPQQSTKLRDKGLMSALGDARAEGRGQDMGWAFSKPPYEFNTGLRGTAKEMSQIAAIGIVGPLVMAPLASTSGVTAAGKAFLYNGAMQGSINLGLSYLGNLAAYKGDFAEAFDNLDLADGAVGFITGGISSSWSMIGTGWNIVGGSLIDWEPGDGYQTFGGYLGGDMKDPWKVTGDILFGVIGGALESKILIHEVSILSKYGNYIPTRANTLTNDLLDFSDFIYGFGTGDFLNEVFNNSKPKVIEEYGFRGTKR
jgi:RHS repeat-associated protein